MSGVWWHCLGILSSAKFFSSRRNAAICRKVNRPGNRRTMWNSFVLKTIGWPTLACCRRRQKLFCLWQLVQGQGPPALQEKLPVSISSRTEHIFRSLASLAVPKCSKSLLLATFLPSTILLWNSLPSFTLSSSSLASLLQLLDFHFDYDRFSFGLPNLSFVVIKRNVFKLVFDNLTILGKSYIKHKIQKKYIAHQEKLSFYKRCLVARTHHVVTQIDSSFVCFFLLSAIRCEALRQPPNGEISYSKPPEMNRVDWNEYANYTCDKGFVLAGNMTRTCGYSRTDDGLGQWGPDHEPSCVGEYRFKKKALGEFTHFSLAT